MAVFSFTIEDAQVDRVLEAFYKGFNQFDPARTLTRQELVALFRGRIQDYIRGVVIRYEAEKAALLARRTATDQAKTDISVT